MLEYQVLIADGAGFAERRGADIVANGHPCRDNVICGLRETSQYVSLAQRNAAASALVSGRTRWPEMFENHEKDSSDDDPDEASENRSLLRRSPPFILGAVGYLAGGA